MPQTNLYRPIGFQVVMISKLNSGRQIPMRSIDDVVSRFKSEVGRVLVERRYTHDLSAACHQLSFCSQPLDVHHEVVGCEFYLNGRPYGVIVADFDPDYGLLNSANYLGRHSNNQIGIVQLGINLKGKRNSTPEVGFARTDSWNFPFLGVEQGGALVDQGFTAIFLPLHNDYRPLRTDFRAF